MSPAFAPIAKLSQRDGRALVSELDAAGVELAVVLSVGYSFGDERKRLPDPDGLTRAENDWTSGEVVKGGGRLLGFCSANPLRPAAVRELERCLALPGMVGIKQHLGNAGVTMRDSSHVRRVQQVFSLAQRLGKPILVHMRPRGGANYAAEDTRVFLSRVVSSAPDIEIVVAHLAYTGPGYPQSDEAMAGFVEAAERNDPHMRNIYFDVATNVNEETTPEEAALVARRIRQLGVSRVVYGSDLTPPGGTIRRGWEIFRSRLPLTDAEFRQIADNRPRFAR